MALSALTSGQERAYRIISDACAGLQASAPLSVPDPLAVDWGYFLYYVDINGLSGLIQHALASMPSEQRSLIPFRVTVTLRNQAGRYGKRWNHYESLLRQLAERVHERLTIVLIKGAAFKSTLYAASPDVRGMGDIDLLVSSDCSDEVISWVLEWGFKIRSSKNGITAIRDADGLRSVVDVHIDDPVKTRRNPSKALRALLDTVVDMPGYPGLKMPSYEYSMAHGCKHFCEHKDDFRKVLFQDDLKLIRLLDIVMLARHHDPQATRALAEHLGWQEELHLAQHYAQILQPGGSALEFPAERLETALGPVTWPLGFHELIKRVDRAEWLSAQLGDQGSRDLWYSTEKGILNPVNT